jgi:hypothetical protein
VRAPVVPMRYQRHAEAKLLPTQRWPPASRQDTKFDGNLGRLEMEPGNAAPHKYLKTWMRMRPADPFRSSAQTTEVRRNRTRLARDLLTFVHRACCFGWGKKEIGPTGGPRSMIRVRTR